MKSLIDNYPRKGYIRSLMLDIHMIKYTQHKTGTKPAPGGAIHTSPYTQKGDDMKPKEQKAQFIELRAAGQSYSKIAETLHISKSTCSAWERELSAQIRDAEQERLQDLYNLYSMHRQGRITRLGETIARIDSALAEKDLSELPADKLLLLKLKYQQELKAEYSEPITPIDENTLEAILLQYELILEKTQSGEITAAQSKAQLAAVKETLATMTAIDNRDNQILNWTGTNF